MLEEQRLMNKAIVVLIGVDGVFEVGSGRKGSSIEGEFEVTIWLKFLSLIRLKCTEEGILNSSV